MQDSGNKKDFINNKARSKFGKNASETGLKIKKN